MGARPSILAAFSVKATPVMFSHGHHAWDARELVLHKADNEACARWEREDRSLRGVDASFIRVCHKPTG
jgi:hypothetical protein